MAGRRAAASSESEARPLGDAACVQLPGGEDSIYGQFCPVAMAAELLATRWTLVVLGEMLSGSTRFNQIRHGVPRMSTALLARRLRALVAHGVARREGDEYILTAAGRDLGPVVRGLGRWALRWVDGNCTLANLDARLLVWNMRRNLRPEPMPKRRVVVEFHYPELPEEAARYWLVVAPGQAVDLCTIDPGHAIDLLVTADLRAMTATWMGMGSFAAGPVRARRDATLRSRFTRWVGRSGLVDNVAAN